MLQSQESVASTLVVNMSRSAEGDFATTAITIEEQMRYYRNEPPGSVIPVEGTSGKATFSPSRIFPTLRARRRHRP